MKPRKFSPSSAKLRRQILKGWSFNVAELGCLDAGLSARDRMLEAGEILKREGLVVTNRLTGVARAHPCVMVEKIGRAQFLQALRQLALREDTLPHKLGRPPGSQQP